jgi:2-polyprenyl-6-hydroxyphenyl methylase/3-demethylubiquinone-9 3-methyltransferase
MNQPKVNNDFYETLGNAWYEGDTHAVALLRKESAIKLDFIREILGLESSLETLKILDVGCGAGFIANPLAQMGYKVKGIDVSPSTIEQARRRAVAGLIYEVEDAFNLRDQDGSYDVVLVLDVLEHVEEWQGLLKEAARVLKPGGLLFYHTFNRTILASLIAVHGMKLVVRDCPDHLHVSRLFIPPGDLKKFLFSLDFILVKEVGVRPDFFSTAFLRTLLTRRVAKNFSFTYTGSKRVGYMGCVKKGTEPLVPSPSL